MRFLMHSTKSLDLKITADDLEKYEMNNIGSIVHQYALWQTLKNEENIIDFANFFKLGKNDSEINNINQQYDCIVLSLGDVFRTDVFEKKQIDIILNILRNIKIKVLVIGIACRRRFWMSIEKYIEHYNAGEIIKEFITECLKHTNIIGIRGYDTAEILNRLGFIENKDYYVCGCPSMFLNDEKILTPREIVINDDSKIITNRNFNIRRKYKNAYRFFYKNIMKYNNSETIFTWFYDVLNIINNTSKYGKKNDRPSIDEYKKLRYLFCYNIDEYFNLLKNYDICIGERMHGCIASIAVGVPTIVICVDFRMKELCDYHSIPYQLITNINEKISFKKLTELADFTKIHEKHQINFERYKNFFKLNEIPTKYTLK